MDIPEGTDLSFVNRSFKVLLFIEADHELIIEGRAPLSIRSGDLLIQPSPVRQLYRAARKNAVSRIHVVRFLLDLPLPEEGGGRALRASRSSKGKTLRDFFAVHLNEVRFLPCFITPRIQEWITRLREEVEMRRPGYRFSASHIGFSLIIEAIRQINPIEDKPGVVPLKKADMAVARTKEYLAENLALPLTLDQIAWHVRLSREHLARLFRQAAGQTVFECLTRIRIDAARTHLCNPNLLVAEVARRSGFSSAQLFCRTFKKMAQITPLEYRKQRMAEVRFSPSRYVKSEAGRRRVSADLF